MNELTAEMAVDIAVPDDLHLSPDGQHVTYVLAPYYKREEYASSALWIGRLGDTIEAHAFTQTDAENTAPRWSPDGKYIAFLSDRAQRGTLQLYTIAFSGGEAQALTAPELTKSIHSFAWSPQGGQIAFTSSDEPTEEDKKREKDRNDALIYGENWPYDHLRLISLANKEVSTLVGGQRHITEIAWHPEGNEIAYVVRQTPDLESLAQEVVIERVALAGGEPREVCRFPIAVASLFWAPDGETLYFIASVAPKSQSSQALYMVAVQGGEPRRLFGGETTCVMDARPLRQNPHVAALSRRREDCAS